MVTQEKLDALFAKYFTLDLTMIDLIKNFIKKPSRYNIPPLPSGDDDYVDDAVMSIAGHMVGFRYLRTYMIDDFKFILRVVVIGDDLVYASVGCQAIEIEGASFAAPEYFFYSESPKNPELGQAVPLCFLTNGTKTVVDTFERTINELLVVADNYIDTRERQAYATYRDLKNYLRKEQKIAAQGFKFPF